MDWWNNFSSSLGKAWNGAPAVYGTPVANGEPWGGFPMAAGSSAPAAMPAYMDAGGYSNLSSYAPQPASVTGATAPIIQQGSGGLSGWLSNGQNLGTAIQGFGSLAQAYLGFQAMKQAKEGLKFQKEAFNANLGNSIKSYNTQLEDRINGRTSAYEGKERDVSAYLAKHQLTR